MDALLRKTGIPSLGDAPWGTHLCQFFKTKDDLVDMLIPYFQAGLENNEFCLWITADPLSVEEAREAIKQAIPQFDRYVAKGQIEVVPSGAWFLKGGRFDLKRTTQDWIKKLEYALAQGYDGMRAAGNVTGSIASIKKADWDDFAEYEQELDRAIEPYKMLVICPYALDKCKATGLVDVLNSHRFALMKMEGDWKCLVMNQISEAALSMLSPREREVLELVSRGYTNREIADRTKISIKSVEAYRARVMVKLNMLSRADLVRFALENNILAVPHN